MVSSTVKGERVFKFPEREDSPWSGDVAVFCPQCKAFETVWIDGNTMIPTRKYIQAGGQIYHDCGSIQPCRLYRIY